MSPRSVNRTANPPRIRATEAILKEEMILEEEKAEAKKLSKANVTPIIPPNKNDPISILLFFFLVFFIQKSKKASVTCYGTEDESDDH